MQPIGTRYHWPTGHTRSNLLSITEISGGGFVFNRTGEEWIFAGVSWLRDGRTDTITWNCFVDGNATEPIPWNSWDMYIDDNAKRIGFVNNETQWGFYVGKPQRVNKRQHCGT